MDDGHILPGVPTVVDGGNNDGNANRADGPLTNPGMGVASFHQGYGEKLPLTEYPDTGIEYERFYWRDLEPEEGKYHFARVDDAFKYAAAHRPAMNVGLRFMALAEPGSGSRIPDWLIKKASKVHGLRIVRASFLT